MISKVDLLFSNVLPSAFRVVVNAKIHYRFVIWAFSRGTDRSNLSRDDDEN